MDSAHLDTVPGRLLHWAAHQPDHEVYIFRSSTIGRMALTRRDVKDTAFAFANRLASIGVCIGDVVCNTLQNSPERVVTDLGIVSCGAVVVDKRTFLPDLGDLVHVLNLGQARMLIVDPSEESQPESLSAWERVKSRLTSVGEVDEATSSVVVEWPEVPTLQRVVFVTRGREGTEFKSLKALQSPGEAGRASAPPCTKADLSLVRPSDLAALFPTSGSTGFPKLSAYRQVSLLDMADNWQSTFRLQEDDVIFQDRPMGWTAAFHWAYLATGTTKVATDGRTQTPEYCPESIWSYVAEEGVTFVHLTPKMVWTLMAMPELIEKHAVKPRHLLMTGQPLMKHFGEVVGTLAQSMYNSFGLTEVAYATAALCKAKEDFQDFLVGFPHPRADVKVVDENLRTVEPGTTGEVLLRVKGQFDGYFREEAKTQKQVLPDGWIRTDDLGFLDEAGRLYMLGRRSEAIMRGVVIIYPHAVEKRLCQLVPGLKEVMVVAVPDPELYHEICACVVAASGSGVTAESVQDACDQTDSLRWTSEIPAPKYVLVFDSFPITPTGKVNRAVLQKEACKKLGL